MFDCPAGGSSLFTGAFFVLAIGDKVMKLSKQIFDQANSSLKKYGRFKEIFKRFFNSANFLTAPDTPVEGVVFKPFLDENYFDTYFDGMRIRFLFLQNYVSDDELMGKIVAVRVWPTFSETPDIVASFTFDGEGFTEFEIANGQDKVNIEYKAAEIILLVLDQALRKPFP
jgi:hypothetical protein